MNRLLRPVLAWLALVGAVALPLVFAGTAPAAQPAVWWHLRSLAVPSTLHPGDAEDEIRVTAIDLGGAPANAALSPVTINDMLPSSLSTASAFLRAPGHSNQACSVPSPQQVSCTFNGVLAPYAALEVVIKVAVAAQGPFASENAFTISGAAAAPATLRRSVAIGEEAPTFGIENYELLPESEVPSGSGGAVSETQAGAHPFQLTTELDLNQKLFHTPTRNENLPAPTALVKDLNFKWPAGLIGNPTAVPQCTELDFSEITQSNTNKCPGDTAVGVASVTLSEPNALGELTETVPVFALVPANGEPARLGFEVSQVSVVIDTAIRTGGDYGVTASVNNTSQAVGLLDSTVSIWGVPGDASHDQSRGWECIDAERFATTKNPCPTAQPQSHPEAFLRLPTSCSGQPLTTIAEADSWAQPGAFVERSSTLQLADGSPYMVEGCGALAFNPSVQATPDTRAASAPSGLSVDVHLPQESGLGGADLGVADVRDSTVTLPEGVELNPGGANGLQGCSLAQIDLAGASGGGCPAAAKVGTAEITTPDLAEPLEGSVYVASPQNFAAPPAENPFQSLVALYIVAEDPIAGVVVKLAGRVTPDADSGQLVTTFENTPQLPFEDLTLHFFDGPNAPLSTPPLCGSYSTVASFSPWSGSDAAPGTVASSSSFAIETEVNGGCQTTKPLRFEPALQAGSTDTQAGGLTPFRLTIGNPDGDQALTGLTMHLPPGIAALLSAVTPCPEPQAAQNECGPASLIGHSVTSSGLGGTPYELPGSVYLTGPYKGAPFGLSVVTPAVAGPFNLGTVTVRSSIGVDRNTAAVTITSDPFPTRLKGIPTQIKQVEVAIERPGNAPFQFNPTNCAAMSVTGSISGAEGAGAPISYPFQATNCAALGFAPKLTASAGGKGSKANGTSFVVKVQSAGLGQANIHRVDLTLPKQLPTRLTTIQKACIDSVFESNPAHCPEGSDIGTATIHTPVLKAALNGPAYLVSHGGAAFPDVEFVLQGEGIELILDGKTDIKKGITYSRFETAPDAPFTTFETDLPAGSHSALTANVPESAHFSLCGSKLSMPTEIGAQNGALIKQTTKIAVTGCGAVKASKTRKLTRAQKLKRALKACRKKRAKAKHVACESQARRTYAKRASKRAKKKR